MAKSVILLDDSREIHILTKKVLESMEINLISCYTEKELLTQIINNLQSLSLVLLDIQMPGKNGFTVLQEIKDRFARRKFKIAFFTSSKEKNFILQGISLKIDAYIIKPFDLC